MFAVRIPRLGQINLRREQMIRPKTGIEVPQMQKAVDQKTGPDQQDKRDRDFTDDQQTAEPRPLAAASCVPAAFLQGFVQAEVRSLRRWREAEDEPGEKGDQRSEAEHLRIDADRLRLGNGIGNERLQDAQPSKSEQETNAATEESEQHAFRQEL